MPMNEDDPLRWGTAIVHGDSVMLAKVAARSRNGKVSDIKVIEKLPGDRLYVHAKSLTPDKAHGEMEVESIRDGDLVRFRPYKG